MSFVYFSPLDRRFNVWACLSGLSVRHLHRLIPNYRLDKRKHLTINYSECPSSLQKDGIGISVFFSPTSLLFTKSCI